jgi:hypothetical protein
VDAPSFVRLAEGAGRIEALFRIRARNGSGPPLILTVAPGLMIDGVLTAETVAGDGEQTLLLSYEDDAGPLSSPDHRLHIPAGVTTDYFVRVSVPETAAVGLHVAVEEAQA